MRFVYFSSNFVPVLIALAIIWYREFLGKSDPSWKKALPLLAILSVIGLINALGENLALQQGIWTYNDPKTLGISIFGVRLETYIYCILVPITIGSAAIKFAERQDRGDAR